MEYFDVIYLSPVGNQGTHYSLEAKNAQEAEIMSPIILSNGTEWAPSQFTVLDVSIGKPPS